MKVQNDPGNLLVSEYGRIRRHPKSRIEYGMAVENFWFWPSVDVGPREAARMGELQSDNGWFIPSSGLPIRLKQCGPQARETRKSVGCKQELIRIRPAVV